MVVRVRATSLLICWVSVGRLARRWRQSAFGRKWSRSTRAHCCLR